MDIFGDRLHVLELESFRRKGARMAVAALRGHIDGVTHETIDKAIVEISARNINYVFLDGSNLGEVAARIRDRVPLVKIVTFFHNVEARFFAGAFKASRTARALAVLVVNYFVERKAVRYSDALILLTRRDSELLGKIYGRRATYISALSLDDRNIHTWADAVEPSVAARQPYLLFVGGAFYANQIGIAWFIENVAPRLNMKTVVIGGGLDRSRNDRALPGNVELVGIVEHLDPWYRGAHCVIAPIFDGSGMKTKVAEALMFGKKVIGTPAAFVGYDGIAENAGWICTTADEFVGAINRSRHSISTAFDPVARQLFDQNYSYTAVRDRLASIFEHIAGVGGQIQEVAPICESSSTVSSLVRK